MKYACLMYLLTALAVMRLPAQPTVERYWLDGQVTDSLGQALSYATVTVNNAQYGTIANDSGYFRIQLPAGDYQLRCTHLGYRPLTQAVRLDRDQSLPLVLQEEFFLSEEVVIVSGDEDPGVAIMREAIRRKDENRLPAEQFRYAAYNKTVMRFPDDFSFMMMLGDLGGQIDTSGLGEVDEEEILGPMGRTKVLYLSETMSTVWKQAPDRIKEEIYRSRISGNLGEASPFGNLFNQFDPYENRVFQGEIAERGIVSPLSDQAMFFYDFQLLGSKREQGQTIYKILVRARRESDPAFRGIVQIADGSYAVQALDLWVTKAQAIHLADSLRLTQEYQQLGPGWAPVSTRMHLNFALDAQIIRIPVLITFTSVLSDYDFSVELPRRFFTGEVIAVTDTAVLSDPDWWEGQRPLPLRDKEALDFRLKDSVARYQQSPAYLDSMTRAQRFPTSTQMLLGYTWRNYRTGAEWHWNGLAESGYNAIEGWFNATGLSYRKPFGARQQLTWETSGRLRYAYSPRRLHGTFTQALEGAGFRPWRLAATIGDYPAEFSDIPQVGNFANTFAALWHKRALIRMYEQRFVQLEGTWRLHPGLNLSVRAWHEQRLPLQNTATYSLRFRDREFEPNFDFQAHTATIGEVTLRYQPGSRYLRMPSGAQVLEARWPELELRYRTALPTTDLSPQYQQLRVTLRDEVDLGWLGTAQYRVSAGQFISHERSYLADAFHFHGGEAFFRMGDAYDQFFLMPYYAYADTRPFVEAHLENAFGLFWINKIPGIRKLKISEYLGAHGLWMEGRQPYLELNYGLEKRIFQAFKLRLDIHVFLFGEDRWLPVGYTYRPNSLFQLEL